MDIAIMIEGQNGLNWPRWKRIVRAVEDLGFAGLFRSDHYTNAQPPDRDSLELWVSLTWLADNTKNIEFGPLVTPFSFRHPALTARTAAAVDDLSNGRLVLGLGAGWQEREHETFGHNLLELPDRFDRFEEGVEVVMKLLRSDDPSDFAGAYYSLRDAILMPRPQRAGGPPLLIGGNGTKRTLPLAARFADEWNGIFLNAKQLWELQARLNGLLPEYGRSSSDLRRSMMTGCYFGRDDAEVKRKLEARGRTFEQMRSIGIIAGTGEQIKEQLDELAGIGLERIMLQWLDLDDLEGLESLAKAIL